MQAAQPGLEDAHHIERRRWAEAALKLGSVRLPSIVPYADDVTDRFDEELGLDLEGAALGAAGLLASEPAQHTQELALH